MWFDWSDGAEFAHGARLLAGWERGPHHFTVAGLDRTLPALEMMYLLGRYELWPR